MFHIVLVFLRLPVAIHSAVSPVLYSARWCWLPSYRPLRPHCSSSVSLSMVGHRLAGGVNIHHLLRIVCASCQVSASPGSRSVSRTSPCVALTFGLLCAVTAHCRCGADGLPVLHVHFDILDIVLGAHHNAMVLHLVGCTERLTLVCSCFCYLSLHHLPLLSFWFLFERSS